MAKRYGIVYMGSKEKILDEIIRYILDRHFDSKYFIDLFAGGFSVSSYILQKNKTMEVIANDLNPYVIALYEEILSGGKNLDAVRYEFVTRRKFELVRDKPHLFKKWYVGYILNVWSFGCNQKDYLYAKDLEKNKRIVHDAIVDDRFDEFENLFPGLIIPKNIRDTEYRKHKKKRIAVLEYTKRYAKQQNDKELLRLQNIEHLNQTEHLSAVRTLVPMKGRISLKNKDWKEVIDELPKGVLKNAVIYCDPPYQDTKQYQVGKDFDYDAFWDWFRNTPYPVYVSSYKAPDDIEPMKFAFKTQLLDNGHMGDNKPKKVVKENLYWNGKGEPDPTMEDLLFPK